jgi:hypothetical protein
MEEKIIERLKLTEKEVLSVVHQWYEYIYPDILQDEDGQELCEITQRLWESKTIKEYFKMKKNN